MVVSNNKIIGLMKHTSLAYGKLFKIKATLLRIPAFLSLHVKFCEGVSSGLAGIQIYCSCHCKSVVLNQPVSHQYSYSNFPSLTVLYFAHAYPIKTMCIHSKREFHRGAASNNPALKSISPEKHLQPLMFLFYRTSNGMTLRRCKLWRTAGLWIRQYEVRMTLCSDFKLTFKPFWSIFVEQEGKTTWGLFVRETNYILL